MAHTDLTQLFTYDEWANREALRSLVAMPSPPERAVRLMAHISGAGRLWLDRLSGASSSIPVWPEMTLEECEALIDETARVWQAYIATAAPPRLSDTIGYANSKGERWTSTVEDVLHHVLTHGAYHRGQIAQLVRQGGGTPAYTDYIHYTRQVIGSRGAR
jgi:uncharacterized damage-inducible protein DinB